jgi:hypothetical protein
MKASLRRDSLSARLSTVRDDVPLVTYLIRSNPITRPTAIPPIALNGSNADNGPRILRFVASDTKLAAETLKMPCGIPPSSLPTSIIPRLSANV